MISLAFISWIISSQTFPLVKRPSEILYIIYRLWRQAGTALYLSPTKSGFLYNFEWRSPLSANSDYKQEQEIIRNIHCKSPRPKLQIELDVAKVKNLDEKLHCYICKLQLKMSGQCRSLSCHSIIWKLATITTTLEELQWSLNLNFVNFLKNIGESSNKSPNYHLVVCSV